MRSNLGRRSDQYPPPNRNYRRELDQHRSKEFVGQRGMGYGTMRTRIPSRRVHDSRTTPAQRLCLSRLSIVGMLGLNTPISVVEEIASAHRIELDPAKLGNDRYYSRIINKIHSTPIQSVTEPFNSADYILISKFINPYVDPRVWPELRPNYLPVSSDFYWNRSVTLRSSLVRYFSFRSWSGFESLSSNFTVGPISPTSPSNIDVCILFRYCSLRGLTVNRLTTVREMEALVRMDRQGDMFYLQQQIIKAMSSPDLSRRSLINALHSLVDLSELSRPTNPKGSPIMGPPSYFETQSSPDKFINRSPYHSSYGLRQQQASFPRENDRGRSNRLRLELTPREEPQLRGNFQSNPVRKRIGRRRRQVPSGFHHTQTEAGRPQSEINQGSTRRSYQLARGEPSIFMPPIQPPTRSKTVPYFPSTGRRPLQFKEPRQSKQNRRAEYRKNISCIPNDLNKNDLPQGVAPIRETTSSLSRLIDPIHVIVPISEDTHGVPSPMPTLITPITINSRERTPIIIPDVKVDVIDRRKENSPTEIEVLDRVLGSLGLKIPVPWNPCRISSRPPIRRRATGLPNVVSSGNEFNRSNSEKSLDPVIPAKRNQVGSKVEAIPVVPLFELVSQSPNDFPDKLSTKIHTSHQSQVYTPGEVPTLITIKEEVFDCPIQDRLRLIREFVTRVMDRQNTGDNSEVSDQTYQILKNIRPDNQIKAIILAAAMYQIDISNCRNPLRELRSLFRYGDNIENYQPLDENLRLRMTLERIRVDGPIISLVFNPHLPQPFYHSRTLKAMAIGYGFSESEISEDNPYFLLQTAILTDHFYLGKPDKILNQQTPIELDPVQDLSIWEYLSYGRPDSGYKVIKYSELDGLFRMNNYFKYLKSSSTDPEVYPIKVINRLAILLLRPFYLNEPKNHQILRRNLSLLINQIMKQESSLLPAERNLRDKYRENSENRQVIEQLMDKFLDITMKMRGWPGSEKNKSVPYPIHHAPVDNGNLVFIRVSNAIGDFDRFCGHLEECAREFLLYPLVKYRGGYVKSNDIDEGFTIQDRLNIVRDGELITSCIRMTSNWFAATHCKMSIVLDKPLAFDITRLAHIG